MELSMQLEGVLFYKATPLQKRTLCALLKVKEPELEEAVTALQNRLSGSGTRVVVTDTEVELVTAPELDELIESVRKDELKRDIGKAGAETLAIILYRGPLSRAEIDRIRGVNSSYILRNLMTRGLIERTESTKQSNQYAVTTTLLRHMGVTSRTELSGYTDTMNALDAYERARNEETART
ncbi:MAG: SMC-Scp complex subunit ScpB [Candidatus Paceibacterota bacterium]